ncbi:MAG: glycerophosphodiester phosphodiesterase [Clostridia bacterium]|nr:glycerophosphodiester phosphodiesterase [Clostridia bacterium]
MIVLIALIAVYLFVLIRPAARQPKDARLLCDYAHRGLHDGNAPENSLAAFEAACRAGVGIELDVQLSRDGEVMVFHDYTLTRMTGLERRLSELDAAELESLRLHGTEETIPRFSQVLERVGGRVPLLVELKGENTDASLCPKVAELLANYGGAYCIESFNPMLLARMKKLLPGTFRGLLYTNVCREKKPSPLNALLTAMALNGLARPDFIAYDQKDRRSLPVRICTKLYRAPSFVWTIRTTADREEARRLGEHSIFEGEAAKFAVRD